MTAAAASDAEISSLVVQPRDFLLGDLLGGDRFFGIDGGEN